MNNESGNERVVIVGASSGIGRATAEMLAGRGYEVLGIGRDEDKLRSLSTGISTRRADDGTAALAAINGAIVAMIPVLAVELAPRRVNAVSPGVVTHPGDAFPARDREALFAQFASRTTFGRIACADDIADVIRISYRKPVRYSQHPQTRRPCTTKVMISAV